MQGVIHGFAAAPTLSALLAASLSVEVSFRFLCTVGGQVRISECSWLEYDSSCASDSVSS